MAEKFIFGIPQPDGSKLPSLNTSQNWGFDPSKVVVMWKGIFEWDNQGYRVA
jgi:hypothetical protein